MGLVRKIQNSRLGMARASDIVGTVGLGFSGGDSSVNQTSNPILIIGV